MYIYMAIIMFFNVFQVVLLLLHYFKYTSNIHVASLPLSSKQVNKKFVVNYSLYCMQKYKGTTGPRFNISLFYLIYLYLYALVYFLASLISKNDVKLPVCGSGVKQRNAMQGTVIIISSSFPVTLVVCACEDYQTDLHYQLTDYDQRSQPRGDFLSPCRCSSQTFTHWHDAPKLSMKQKRRTTYGCLFEL